MVHGNELGPVGEGALDLDLVNHVRYPVSHVYRPEQLAPEIHELRDGTTVANEFEQLCRDQRHRLRMVQPDPAREPLLREKASLMEHQLVDFTRCQMHSLTTSAS